jgi:multicomponent Na+:H+ antiporter subunit E
MRTCIALACAWLLLSGHYTLEEPLIAIFGGLSCAFVFVLAWRMRSVSAFRSEGTVGPRAILYLPWLLGQIVKANVQVARIIVNPKLRIRPHLIRVKASQRGDGAQVLYANSITLTPGTISLDVRNHTIAVHALTDEIAEDLAAGEMDRRVARTERQR